MQSPNPLQLLQQAAVSDVDAYGTPMDRKRATKVCLTQLVWVTKLNSTEQRIADAGVRHLNVPISLVTNMPKQAATLNRARQ